MAGPVQVRSRERVHIRTREGAVTLAAWKVTLESGGAVVLLEIAGKPVYRGEGALLGAGQEKLAEVWRAALPPDEPPEDNPQLG